MEHQRITLAPIPDTRTKLRHRLGLKGELALAALPTLTVLAVLVLVETLSQQRLLFASLASSAFLIYLDPHHNMNAVRTLVISQLLSAVIGFALYLSFGPGYIAAGSAMVAAIVLMILLDVVHPPAVASALSFAFKAESERNLVLFGFALLIVAMLVLLQQWAIWLLARLTRH
jgi:CBS-domain-containing membrane protein